MPVIEGMIWDFALHIHQREGTIYNNNKCSSITTINNKIINEPTIGAMLKNTTLNDVFDEHFVNYFCDELYNERNPILHGRNTQNLNELNAAKKIATIEYLLLTTENYIRNFNQQGLKKKIPVETRNSILSTLNKKF